MSEIILHHYPQSPVTEKVRVGFGIKQLEWRSVEVARIPPRPLLHPLTGGYRRVPVMQIGADIYCDSECILREIDRRYPEPTFYPGGGYGMPWALNGWTSGKLFETSVALVLGSAADELPEDFAADRGRLYFGPDHDLKAIGSDAPHLTAQLRPQLGWLDQRLAHGRAFILGDEPGLPDATCYFVVWFLRGRWAGGPEFLSQFSHLEAWEARVRDIGHGKHSDLQAQEALEIGKEATPQTPEQADPGDPQGLEPGMPVTVTALGIGGDPSVAGTVRYVDRETIAILREDETAGSICQHFPRTGYRVAKA